MTLNLEGSVWTLHVWQGLVLRKMSAATKAATANPKKTRIKTIARLHQGECSVLDAKGACIIESSVGETLLNPEDGFRASRGRFIAVDRAAQKAGLSKQAKSDLFVQYTEQMAALAPPRISKGAAHRLYDAARAVLKQNFFGSSDAALIALTKVVSDIERKSRRRLPVRRRRRAA